MGIIKKIFKPSRLSEEDGIFFDEMKKLLGFNPVNLAHYRRAFTHRSSNKTDEHGNPLNYERLEFLGDAMLGSVIAAHLFTEAPAGDEGYLTKMRSKIVSREHLNELGRDLNLIKWVESKVSSQHFGENIHGNLFEAFIGAIYLDKGFTYCEKFIYKKVIIPYVDIPRLEGKVISYKSLLIEWCQKEKKKFNFEIYEDNGVEGQKYFGVRLKIDGKIIAKARATSKKKAEEKAAQRAYFAFQEKINKK
ncbi:ribonuclease III [Flavobacterium coralii]|uniref:ribonuclease III n=1 Tax=Flavobacterium coralii TaxID=2838017 RepID=UPI000C4B392B|nr:ribonuclease III [Flavobacterium sp.]|tara:strand:- start:49264 stop:50007 length:744 start_codon:yes stop_codon:yes gene_type:complete